LLVSFTALALDSFLFLPVFIGKTLADLLAALAHLLNALLVFLGCSAIGSTPRLLTQEWL